jgi:hypothetical protein
MMVGELELDSNELDISYLNVAGERATGIDEAKTHLTKERVTVPKQASQPNSI